MTPRKNFRHESGLTAPELVMSIGVFSIILIVVIGTYFAYVDVFRVQIVRGDVQRMSQRMNQVIVETVRGSSNVLSSRTINGTSYLTDGDTLVLELPVINSNGDIVASVFDDAAVERDASDSTKYFLDLQADASSTRKTRKTFLGEFVSRLAFEYNDSDLTKASEVTILLTLSKATRSQTATLTTETHAKLRNK